MNIYWNSWKQEHLSRVVELAKNPALSAAAIAKAVNDQFGTRYSRSAVLGKMHRGKIQSSRPRGVNQHFATERAPRKTAGGAVVQQLKNIAAAVAAAKPVRPQTEAPFSDPAIDTDGVTEIATGSTLSAPIPLFDATAETCRWPAAPDGSAHMICGARVARGAYCAVHGGLAYRPHTWRARRDRELVLT